jgi:L-methionine (R)-S-oxide reductase
LRIADDAGRRGQPDRYPFLLSSRIMPWGLDTLIQRRGSLMTNSAEVLNSIRRIALTAPDAPSLLTEVVRLLQRERPHYHWVGVYLLQGQELVLGPYVGNPTPHTRIPMNRGICGAAASTGETIIVDDVNSDPRYVACNLETRSEIVVPIKREGRILGEMDIDSDVPAAFTNDDRDLLEAVAELLAWKI